MSSIIRCLNLLFGLQDLIGPGVGKSPGFLLTAVEEDAVLSFWFFFMVISFIFDLNCAKIGAIN
jgi:hypothetical protein